MSWFYRRLIRPVFFKQDPEEVHTLTMRWLGRVSRNVLVLHGEVEGILPAGAARNRADDAAGPTPCQLR